MRVKQKRSWIPKLMALCLAMVLTLSMSMTVFAVKSTDTGNIKVNGLDSENQVTVSAYQIITVNVDDASGQPSYPMYTWNSEVADWLKENGYETYIDSNLGTNAVADAFGNMADDDQIKFLQEIAAAIRSGSELSLNAAATQTTTQQGGAYAESVTFSDMTMGEYLLIASGGVKIYAPTTASVIPTEKEGTWTVQSTEVEMKSEAPGIDKDIVDDDDNTVAIGDTVTYKLTTKVPDYPENATNTTFYITDKLGAGFDYSGNSTIKVYKGSIDPDNIVTDGGNYTVSNPEGTSFRIDFTSTFVEANATADIIVTYDAVVNENAFETDALGNDTVLVYANDPYADGTFETPDDYDVYTYGIQIDKVDKEGNPLPGAQFTLSTSGNTLLHFTETAADGVYRLDPDSDNTVLEVSADGTLEIQGLDLGTYILKETKAPSDHVLPTGTITIVLGDNEPDGTLESEASSATAGGGTITIRGAVTVSKNIISFDIENTSTEDAGFTLPTTGGMGTALFTIAGILLMGGAVVLVAAAVRRKRG